MEEGFIKAGPGKDRSAFDIAPTVQVEMGSDLASCRESVKPNLAFYIGCMGAKGRNFYYDLACRYGYEESCEKIRDFYLDGRKIDAEAAVPDSLVDEVALCGSRERIADRMQLWREAGVTTLICSTRDITTLRAMAEIAL